MPWLPDAHIPNGILFDEEGNVVFDSYAEATGMPAFKTRAEVEAANARLEAMLKEHREEQAAEKAGEEAADAVRGSGPT
jgi:hypothetical protein